MNPSRRRAVAVGAALCFFFSGAAGLIYEVVWTRLLGLVFGHTVYAVTTVLASYMGGLAIGSLVLGRWADRVKRPLRAYATLEAAIGLCCSTTPFLFKAVDALYVSAYRALQPSASVALALQFVLSSALLVAPATLMGATLPVLSRVVVEAREAAASRVGWLYAVNTTGAVVGTLASGLFLLPEIGLRATVVLAVVLNLGVAAVALLLERRVGSVGGAASPDRSGTATSPVASTTGGTAIPRPQLALGLATAGISGAASMAYEVSWTRTLSLVLGSSTYAFTAMLSTFLVGLALGAFAVARLLRSRRLGLSTFGHLQVAIALSALALLPVFGWLPEAALALLSTVGVSPGAALAVQFVLSFAVVIAPTLLIGGTFPAMVAALGQGLGRLGRDVGLVYGANTIGTILGSVAAGFLLIPRIGIQNTVRVAAGANLCAGMALLLFAGAGARARGVAVAALGAFVALVLVLPRWDQKVMTSGVAVYADSYVGKGAEEFRSAQEHRDILFYSEGISTTVAVERALGNVALRANGKVEASNGNDMPTQVLLGHLGALLHPNPRRALVIGLASGVTVGAVAQHPFDVIDVAELEPAMLGASRFFENENRRAMSDPRVRLVAGDGRHILAAATQPYDVIVSEPSNPWIAGIGNLFTTNFYEIARTRLSERGVFVQWIQGYGIFPRDMQMVVRTIQEVFPHLSIWTSAAGDFLLVATPETLRVDLAEVARRVAASPGLREDFDRFGWNNGDLVFRFFLDEEGARRFGSGAPRNTDDRPLLEFRAPMAIYSQGTTSENSAAMRASKTPTPPPFTGGDLDSLAGPKGHLRAAHAYWQVGWYSEARKEIALAGPPDRLDQGSRMERARLLLLTGGFGDALPDLTALSKLDSSPGLESMLRVAVDLERAPIPAGAEVRGALLDRCIERRLPGYCDLMLEQLAAELKIAPNSVVLLTNYAGALYQSGDLVRAESALRRALTGDPRLVSTRYNLGLLLEKQGRNADAAAEYASALRLDPASDAIRQRLSALGEIGAKAAHEARASEPAR
jgi:spermidine synthase